MGWGNCPNLFSIVLNSTSLTSLIEIFYFSNFNLSFFVCLVIHPGLRSLIKGDDPQMVDIRWKIFAHIISPGLAILKNNFFSLHSFSDHADLSQKLTVPVFIDYVGHKVLEFSFFRPQSRVAQDGRRRLPLPRLSASHPPTWPG